jgi:hypothetical protein
MPLHWGSKTAMITKTCTDCGATKPLDLFSKRNRSKDGKRSYCKDCGARQTRDWVSRNKEKKRKADADYNIKNHAKVKATRLKWLEKHPNYNRDYYIRNFDKDREAAIERARLYRKANPGKINAWSAARHARELRATPPWVDHKAIQSFYIEAARLTRETGIKHHVDHIYPLKSKVMCGLHCQFNLQILTAKENRSKSNVRWPGHGISISETLAASANCRGSNTA